MNQSLIRLPVVQERTGLSRSTIYAFVSQGRFPKPVHLGARSVGWVDTDVQDWIRARINLKAA